MSTTVVGVRQETQGVWYRGGGPTGDVRVSENVVESDLEGEKGLTLSKRVKITGAYSESLPGLRE